MSGTMQQPQRPMPMAAPPQMPMAPQQQMPQQMPQGGAPQQPPLVPPMVGGMAAQNPNLALFARAAQGAPQPGQSRLTTAEMARMGRFGDQVIGHMAPGEIAVPPELQTPKVLATLHQAFGKVGVSPQTFTAGSPQNVHNPATGAPEFSLLGALLPVAGAVIGSIIPGIGTAAGMAAGGAIGGAAGAAIDHAGPLGILGGAAGGGLGGYLGGSGGLSGLLGSQGAAGAAGAASAAAPAAATTAPFGAMAADVPSAGAGAATMAGAGPLGSAVSPAMSWGQRLMGGMYAGTGAGIGQSFAPPQQNTSTSPPGFDTPMTPLNTNYGALLGSHQANRPSFTGYNPYTSVFGPNPGYRFFPVS